MRSIAIKGRTYGATNVIRTIVTESYTLSLTEVKHRALVKYIVTYRGKKQDEVVIAIEGTQYEGEVAFENTKNFYSWLK